MPDVSASVWLGRREARLGDQRRPVVRRVEVERQLSGLVCLFVFILSFSSWNGGTARRVPLPFRSGDRWNGRRSRGIPFRNIGRRKRFYRVVSTPFVLIASGSTASGILITGDVGSGKSYLVKSVLKAISVPSLFVSSASVVQPNIGESEKYLHVGDGSYIHSVGYIRVRAGPSPLCDRF